MSASVLVGSSHAPGSFREDTATAGQQNTEYLFSGRGTKSDKLQGVPKNLEKLEDPLNLHYLGWYGRRRQSIQSLQQQKADFITSVI